MTDTTRATPSATTDLTSAETSAEIDRLGQELIRLWQRRDPFRAAPFGFADAAHRLPDLTGAGTAELAHGYAAIGSEAGRLLSAGSPEELSVEDRLSLEVLLEQGEAIAASLRSGFERHTVNTVREFSTATVLAALGKSPVEPDLAQAHLDRLAALPRFVADEVEALTAGADSGWPATLRALDGADRELATQQELLDRPDEHPGVTCLPEGPARAEAARLLADVAPDLDRCREAYAELRARARGEDREGLCWVDGGEAAYAALLREETTLTDTPEQMHAWAVEEHARLLEAAAADGVRPGGPDGSAGDAAMLSGAEFLAAAQKLMEQAVGALPDFFSHDVPDCPVREMPAATAARYGAGQYMPGSVDGSVSGRLYVNTTRPRPAAEVPGLVAGGAVPGSHVFWSIAFAAPVPLFRRVVFVPAFVKGWAAHSLTVADQMGLFDAPGARRSLWAKRLANAARAVVDTGVHAHGWSRAEVMKFFAEGTLQAEADVRLDLARMLSLPGDGTIFAIGAREIGGAQAAAREHIGGAVSDRRFHGELLGHGALPLASMRAVVGAWSRTEGGLR